MHTFKDVPLNMYYFVFLLILSQLCNCKYFYSSKRNIFSVQPEDKSYFGYAVQLQVNNFDGRLIIGAPKANSTYINNTFTGGAVYVCTINTGNCNEIHLDSSDGMEEIRNSAKATVQNFGLGSSLNAAVSENGFIIICAPRWRYKSKDATIGKCYTGSNLTLPNKLYPLNQLTEHTSSTYYSQYGQVGFSIHLIEEQGTLSSTFILGSPGIYNYTGTLVQYNSLDKNEKSLIVEAERPDKKINQYSYFGYSISAGRFNSSDANQLFYVAGAPRNNVSYGSVNIFDPVKNENEPFKNKYMFQGTQFGEYFGSSIAVGDIDNDDLDDIIIGAPMFSMENADDVGCIYIFQASQNPVKLAFKKHHRIVGEKRGSRFGFAISFLGDINNDGFKDIAVGAPYFENTGAIYVYIGSKMGLKPNYKQKIIASDIDENLRGFGCSLSRGLDVDHNSNNDVAVGAYLSGQVVLLTSRPVIKIKINMTLSTSSQLNINTTSLNVVYCIDYTADSQLPAVNIDLIFSILNPSKVVFKNNANIWTEEITTQDHFETCKLFSIYIQDHIYTDINIKMDYYIKNATLEEKFRPIEEQHSHANLHVPFNKRCSSNVCKPNIKLSAYFKNNEHNWVIGSSQNMELQVELINFGEPSYTNKLFISVFPIHKGLVLFPNICSQTNKNIICNIKYPIWERENKSILFPVDVTKFKLNDKTFSLNITILSNDDIDTTDNTIILEIPLSTDIHFRILAKSQPEEIHNFTDLQRMNHQFNIENNGTTLLSNLRLYVLIPYELKNTNFIYALNISGCENTTISNDYVSMDRNNNELITNLPKENSLYLNCTSLRSNDIRCKKIECEINKNEPFNSAIINLTLIVNTTILDSLHGYGPIIISTTLAPDSEYITSYTNTWTILWNKQQVASITVWLVIGTGVALLLVIILVFILYKCGFFTKKKLPDEHDAQELLKEDIGVTDK